MLIVAYTYIEVELVERIWLEGGGETLVDRTWLLLLDVADFGDKFNQTQGSLWR